MSSQYVFFIFKSSLKKISKKIISLTCAWFSDIKDVLKVDKTFNLTQIFEFEKLKPEITLESYDRLRINLRTCSGLFNFFSVNIKQRIQKYCPAKV